MDRHRYAGLPCPAWIEADETQPHGGNQVQRPQRRPYWPDGGTINKIVTWRLSAFVRRLTRLPHCIRLHLHLR